MHLRILVFAGVLLSCASIVRAWDSIGHLLITQIAEDQLTPEARSAIEESMARFNAAKRGEFPSDDATYDMVTASCWMDDIRALREKYNFDRWHYINLSIGGQEIPLNESEHEPNVRWGVQRCVEIISGKAESPRIDRDQALVMLLHLVGDAHQPMHTANRNNDLGGNRVRLENVDMTAEEKLFSKRSESNLHAFWDSSYRRVFRDGKAGVLYEAPVRDKDKPVSGHAAAKKLARREADALKAKYPPSVVDGQKDAAAWVQESHEAGYESAYGKLPNQSRTGDSARVDRHYVTASRELAQKRVAMAGYRLGAMLNELLATKAGPGSP